MKQEDVRRITVVGVGLMGHGIALEFATAGYEVHITDVSEETLTAAVERIRASLRLLADVGAIAPDGIDAAIARITPEPSMGKAAANADVVIEAVFEDLGLKRRIFAVLDTVCPERTVLASNTSTYVPSAIASATKRPDRVLVAHYFNPPHLLPIVEVVRGPETSTQTLKLITSLLRSIGKQPAVVQKEVPGFVGNRLQMALDREALAMVRDGVASVEDIDTVVKYGFGRRLAVAGLFEVGELAGWDVLATIAGMLFPDIDDSKQVPAILQERIDRGDFGVKSGRGFYDWTPESADALRRKVGEALAEMARWDKSP